MVSSEALRALGPTGLLVNVSHGSFIGEAAMVQQLEDRNIADTERLFALEYGTLLPHVASATPETRQAMADLVLENLQIHFCDGQVQGARVFSCLTHRRRKPR